jgi:nucleotide-binding universal stress UspA family protein
MYRNILVPVALDHERDVSTALAVARALVAEGGTVTALTVVEAVPSYILAEFPENLVERNRDAAAEALKAEVGGADVRTVAVTGHSARSILDYAEAHEVDCIVIASHRPGLQDFFLGSTAARVVRHATCSVHVVR